jgi:hypothetical protein
MAAAARNNSAAVKAEQLAKYKGGSKPSKATGCGTDGGIFLLSAASTS